MTAYTSPLPILAALALLAGCVPDRVTQDAPVVASQPVNHPATEAECEGSMDLPLARPGATPAAFAEPPSLSALKDAAPYRQLDTSGSAARLAMVRQAALSLGMRAGFNRGIWCRQQEILRRTAELDRIYNFAALLFEAGGGYEYEPGVVTEEFDVRKIANGGTKAAAAAARITMPEKENLVSRPRDWRWYLVVDIEPLAPQAPEMRPLPEDGAQWQRWVDEGWKRGLRQAADTMEDLWNRLDKDYVGMVAYRRMMLEGRVSPPRSLVTDRGVTGTTSEVRIGDVQVETRRAGQLQPNPAQWRPLPFITAEPSTGGTRQ